LHNENGPALLYPDGFGIWAVHGVRVPQAVIEEKEKITPRDIHNETNTEVRRVMIDLMTPERYLYESGAERIHTDKFGELYRINNLPHVLVRVTNATPEPDGTFKRYCLWVDPTLYGGQAGRVVQAAIASTWRKQDGTLLFDDYRDYDPGCES